jgi:MarR family transcriptional regulator, organic hydroperoxide resistance regulator
MAEETANSLYVTLVAVLIQAKRQVVDAGAQFDLTPAQSLTLLLMPEQDLQTMHDISVRMGCDASNATGLIDALESKKLIVREEKPGDRRTKIVRLLDKGHHARQQIISELATNSGVTKKLSATEVEQLQRILQKLLAS